MQDGVFFSALLTGPAQVKVTISGSPAEVFEGTSGVNHWSLPFLGRTGAVKFEVVRGGAVAGSGTGAEVGGIGGVVDGGCSNYNAWVGGF